MTDLPPLPRTQRTIDAKHLQLLSIFHFVGAGLAFLGILFVAAHFAVVHSVFGNPSFWQQQKQPVPPPQLMALFKWFYLVMALWFIVSGALNIISGLCLRARKYQTFSIVVAAINCLHLPLGTILGVFTIVVLMRDSVGELYQASGRPAF